MKDIRVRRVNVVEMTAALVAAGHSATWRAGATTSYGNGCTDPECCPQHPEAIVTVDDNGIAISAMMDPNEWATITTDASGVKAHKIWVAARMTT